MNPSNYLYFDDTRWVPETSYNFEAPSNVIRDSISACRNNHEDFERYNEYPYGLEELTYGYHIRNNITDTAVISRYRNRNIVHLVGENDDNPSCAEEHGLGCGCPHMLQGNHRRERGEIYAAYLRHFFGNRPNHHFEVVGGAGHNSRQMITSTQGRYYIFNMTTLADYMLIRDSSFSVRAGESKDFEIELPRDAVSSSFSKRPILAFFVDPSADSKNLQLAVDMNGAEIVNYSYKGGVGRGHWEAFTHDHLRIGDANNIRFAVVRGTGTLNISDVILWYQRNVF